MGSVVSGLFGGGAPGPDKELIEAQKRQAQLVEEREQREQEELDARRRLISAQSGRVGLGTAIAGEEGVAKKTTLGG